MVYSIHTSVLHRAKVEREEKRGGEVAQDPRARLAHARAPSDISAGAEGPKCSPGKDSRFWAGCKTAACEGVENGWYARFSVEDALKRGLRTLHFQHPLPVGLRPATRGARLLQKNLWGSRPGPQGCAKHSRLTPHIFPGIMHRHWPPGTAPTLYASTFPLCSLPPVAHPGRRVDGCPRYWQG